MTYTTDVQKCLGDLEREQFVEEALAAMDEITVPHFRKTLDVLFKNETEGVAFKVLYKNHIAWWDCTKQHLHQACAKYTFTRAIDYILFEMKFHAYVEYKRLYCVVE